MLELKTKPAKDLVLVGTVKKLKDLKEEKIDGKKPEKAIVKIVCECGQEIKVDEVFNKCPVCLREVLIENE
jgi:hypothetical protein